MVVTRLEITSREPYADGQSFGETGPYERINGVLHYAVDPEHPANQTITDLQHALRTSDGLVTFSGDVTLLVPQDPAKGTRRALIEDPNRGRTGFHRNFNRSRAVDEKGGSSDGSITIDPGDGFLFRHGFTVASVGWQWDVRRGGGMMGFDAPEATIDGQPIPGQTVTDILPSVEQNAFILVDRGNRTQHRPMPVANVDDPDAVLRVREHPDGPDRFIPRDEWQFARETEDGEIVPSPEHIYLRGGFKPGLIYRLIYTTERAYVGGTGLLALRDAASFLRYGSDVDAFGGHVDRVYGWGRSQTGRVWRHFVWLGLNLDEEDRQAFDGMIPLVAGSRRGEYNQRHGKPSARNYGHMFPFHAEEMEDPYTGECDGLLKRQRERGGVPKMMFVNTAAEYWRGDGSLTHTDPAGTKDVADAPETRNYLFASTQHMIGVVPLIDVVPFDNNRGRYYYNALDYTPLLRATLMNLDRWCAEGTEPPPSRYPRFSDGTLISRAEALEFFKKIPGVVTPNPEHLPLLRRHDVGDRAAEGIFQHPVTEHEIYPSYVSSVDGDGNEVAGIRPPDVTVPVATYTGWNPRHPEIGAPEQILNMHGSTLIFPRTKAEREALGDPRLSIEERYPNRDDYLAKVRRAAEELVEQGYLLSEDIDAVLADAGDRYDAALSTPPPGSAQRE